MSDSKFINTALAIVPVLSIVLYLMGYLYHQGFLSAYGVESSLFPQSSDVIFLYGFYALIPTVVSLTPVLYVMAAMLALLFMAILAYTLASSSRVDALHKKLFAKKANDNKNNLEIKQKIDGIVEKSESAYYYFLGAFLILLVAVFLARFAFSSGKDLAVNSITNFNNQIGKWVMLYSSDPNSPIKAQQVICGSTHCAFWLGDKSLILGHDKIEKVVGYKATKSN